MNHIGEFWRLSLSVFLLYISYINRVKKFVNKLISAIFRHHNTSFLHLQMPAAYSYTGTLFKHQISGKCATELSVIWPVLSCAPPPPNIMYARRQNLNLFFTWASETFSAPWTRVGSQMFIIIMSSELIKLKYVDFHLAFHLDVTFAVDWV